MSLKLKTCFCLLLSIFIFASCSSSGSDTTNQDIIVKEFPKTAILSGKPAKEIMLTTTWANLVVVDTFLVVQKREAPFIKIYSTNNHKLLGEIGTQGSGPNEFEMPDILKQISYDKENNSPVVTLYDLGTYRISKVNILKVIEGSDNAITQERAPDLNSVTVTLHHIDHSLFLANPETGGRFVILNSSSKDTTYIPFIPELDVEMKDYTKFMIFQSSVVINKKRNRFVAAPTYLDELNFFDLKGNYIRSTIISPRENLLPPPGIQSLPTGIIRHSSSLVEVENKIYALKKGPDEGKIQVFDWDGNPLEQYTLEVNSRIGSFAYDKIHKQFYVCFPDEEPYNIYTYPLN
ncbi:TolB-like protein [Roseivirga ehrenbergii]|uniref:6-bladed beta-propeller n=1 Tax=Roseivirga ehrenbergii (strain DSM 102268 / JCM 13514 / KCTC 12282 / NCIMB 14502 / KMM 6017) TaxID=279360 RepID=A0A150XC51_ROSEK|nr:BF3164 family lipoprotein [Roseivirga ehrenbergii]KYG76293.1 hypothetical protein MB14_03330 [Roseivirga ehrenbergii]TCL00176.1 TolB-like protein [Roseivirga ehrenbergii]